MKKILSIEKMEFKKINFGYSAHSSLFENLTIKFPLGHVTWVYGSAGVGKSSLLKVLAGLMLPSSGDFLINGVPVQALTFEEFLPFRMKIGYCSDQGGLLSNRTLKDNLTLPLLYHQLCSVEEAEEKANHYLDLFRIREFATERPSSVSRGMQKSVLLARALILSPEILILDDPTAGLGREEKSLLKERIEKEKKSGALKHIFIASEDYPFLQNFITQRLEIVAQTLYLNGQAAEDEQTAEGVA